MFLIFQLQCKYQYKTKVNEETINLGKYDHTLEDLKAAFELAERTSPGISETMVKEIFKSMLPLNYSESRLTILFDKITAKYEI